jgi:hypothetical protein
MEEACPDSVELIHLTHWYLGTGSDANLRECPVEVLRAAELLCEVGVWI